MERTETATIPHPELLLTWLAGFHSFTNTLAVAVTVQGDQIVKLELFNANIAETPAFFLCLTTPDTKKEYWTTFSLSSSRHRLESLTNLLDVYLTY